MTLIEARNRFRNQLSSLYAQAEIDHIFKCCIAHYFNWEGIKIGLTPELILHAEEETILLEVLNSLADATPLQYILGETTFHGLILKVRPGVLFQDQKRKNSFHGSWMNKTIPQKRLLIYVVVLGALRLPWPSNALNGKLLESILVIKHLKLQKKTPVTIKLKSTGKKQMY